MVDFLKEYEIDIQICKDLIQYFDSHPMKEPGKSGNQLWQPQIKSSTDVTLQLEDFEAPAITAYMNALGECLEKYKNEFPSCTDHVNYWHLHGANIQHYAPTQGYYKWHCEKSSTYNANRHLVFSTYLNTVTDGGHTEFLHQEKAIEAVEGKTIIFPSDWTYTHKGRVSETQDKYIITGWYNFADLRDDP